MRDMVVLLGAEVPSGRAVAKKLRAEQYCCALMSSDAEIACIKALEASGIIIAGEESEGAARPDPAVLSLGVPVLAFGSAARALLDSVGRRQETAPVRDTVMPVFYQNTKLFASVDTGERWIGEAAFYELDEPYHVIADGDGVPVAFASEQAQAYLLQFQIERNDPDGTAILINFADAICGCTRRWTGENILRAARDKIIAAVGDGEAVCAMSGGLDSTVAAMLARDAIGSRAHCVFVDTGLLREGEAEATERAFSQELGLDFRRIDMSGRILEVLRGVSGMEGKWRVIDREITGALATTACENGQQRVFIKGTNYVDILANGCADDPRGAGGFQVVEPLGELFKGEIRMLGEMLGLPAELLHRQPFPGMGLAARIRGEVTDKRLKVLRRADAIFTGGMTESGQAKRMSRYFAMYEEAPGGDVIILRALQGAEPSMTVARLPYDLLERTVERILAELPAVTRVMYDMTPGMAEWPLQ